MGKDGQRRGGDRQKRQAHLMSTMFEEMWLNRDAPPVSPRPKEHIIFKEVPFSESEGKLLREENHEMELLPDVLPLVDSVSQNNEEEALERVSNLFHKGVPIGEIVDGIIAGIRTSGRGKEK